MNTFINTVWDYYKSNKRIFPWRETSNPYHIFVSEIMLQQTQANRVIPFYTRFISRFLSIYQLANSTFSDIVRVWKGLGYNRRATYIHESAKIIVKKNKGIIPKDCTILDSLPGIGPNTACSIITFSYNIPTVFIETNIRTVYIHHFFDDAKNCVSDKGILTLVKETLDKSNPREWYWALMDYGSFLKKQYPHLLQKSNTYEKQRPFVGSQREVRGKIVDLLIRKTCLNITEMKKHIRTKHDIDEIIHTMAKEKIIKITKGSVRFT